MKKIYLFLVMITAATLSHATIIHVDNNPNHPAGYYSDLQVAVNTASAGDTLFVYASNTTYGNITLTKKLYMFGSGYDGTQGSVSKINYMAFDTTATPSSNPSGTVIQGFTFASNITCSKPNIKNISFSGNYLNYVGLGDNCSGWTFSNNYINDYLHLNYNASIVINNNVFRDNSYGIYYSNSSTVVISNNLFMDWKYFYSVHNATVSNNIFICNGDPNSTNMSNNTFINNIAWRNTTDPYNLPPTGNTGSGNISNTDPQFETALSYGAYDYTKDYHVKSASSAKNAGTDGTDMGPYGGINPFIWGGAMTIPKVTEMIIKNPIVNQGTPINVNIRAKKADL